MAVTYGPSRVKQMVFRGLESCIATIRVLKDASNRSFSTTNIAWKRHPVPSPKEAQRLRSRYSDPVGIVSRFLRPVTDLDPEKEVQLRVQRYAPCWWKVCLEFHWPISFRVCARNEDVQVAEANAYLLACESLMNIGLITRTGEDVPFTEELMRAHKVCKEGMMSDVLMDVRSQCTMDTRDMTKWTSVITLNWPVNATHYGCGLTQEDALRNAAVKIFIKLKALGCIDNHNRILPANVMILPGFSASSPFIPDYEIYTDASFEGYGAVLYSNDTEDKRSESIRWISDFWPEQLKENFMTPRPNSTVFEFCGILTSVYTWKKKFADKMVLVYCDNLTSCEAINDGIIIHSRYRKKIGLHLNKMFKVLRETCVKHNIRLRAEWLDRKSNCPADALSKLDKTRFKTLVPNASETAKKPKKMLFCLPLVENTKNKESKPCTSETEES